MKIAVIGANGKTGKVFVKAALENGHVIRAGMFRSQYKFPRNRNLTMVSCDATMRRDLQELIGDSEIVVSFIGHTAHSPHRVQTNATTQIIQGMSQLHIRRFISLTGTGARIAGDIPSWWDTLANKLVYFFDPERVNDGIAHIKVLQQNTDTIDWTVIRVLKLTNRSCQPYSITLHGPGQLFTSRCTVSKAVLQLINEQSTYIHQAPVISR